MKSRAEPLESSIASIQLGERPKRMVRVDQVLCLCRLLTHVFLGWKRIHVESSWFKDWRPDVVYVTSPLYTFFKTLRQLGRYAQFYPEPIPGHPLVFNPTRRQDQQATLSPSS